ncbi:MAG: thermonuclease family protein [Planctomycetota bacterium]|nr:thermonuclease family protein [Planctomycetota bacterium]
MRRSRRKRFSAAALIAAVLAAILGSAGLLRGGRTGNGVPIPEVALERGRGQVLRVTDGDTLTLRLKRKDGSESEEKVRLIGINAPEMHLHEKLPPDPFAVEARDALAELCPPGSVVEVEEHGRDKYGRLLCRLFAGGKDVGAVLIERGLARHYFLRNQNEPFEGEYREAERRAEKARLGIWSLHRKSG